MNIRDILHTDRQAAAALKLYRETRDHEPNSFARRLADEVIAPNLEAINRRTGQQNDPRYLAYVVELAIITMKEADQLP